MSRKNSPDPDDAELPAPRTARQRRAAPVPAVPDDLMDEVQDIPETRDLIPYSSERQGEFDAMVAARVAETQKAPLYPIPPELAPEYRPYWIELVNSFEKGFFHPVDIPLMRLWCRAAHDIDRCNQLIREEGDIVWGAKGPMMNPRVKVRGIAEAVLFNLSTKLRAQPASRGNSTEFQRNDGKAATTRQANQTIEADEDLLMGAQQRGQSHQGRLN